MIKVCRCFWNKQHCLSKVGKGFLKLVLIFGDFKMPYSNIYASISFPFRHGKRISLNVLCVVIYLLVYILPDFGQISCLV